jgi:AcrR family transcriptional regulator
MSQIALRYGRDMSTSTGRKLRADAERSIRTIMEAAEQLLSENPAATMEQIAQAAGVARTTIHRRFASREELIDTMTAAAWRDIAQAVEASRPETAPPLVVLHQATANVLQIKSGWRFALAQSTPPGPEAQRISASVMDACDALFARAQGEGLLRAGIDPVWARRVYIALLSEAAHGGPSGGEHPDTVAARVVDTLLRGVG